MMGLKAGDRVTSSLLSGEWVIEGFSPMPGWFWVVQGGERIPEVDSRLTLVPSLPSEPPIGSVVYVDGVVRERFLDRWFSPSGSEADWSDIADRATPAVPLADVVQALVEWGDRAGTTTGKAT